ncbi:MAG: FAD:protein FMN transferase [bacterium]
MGTDFRVTFVAAELDDAAMGGQLFRAVDAVDQAMSTWKPASALSQFNNAPLDSWFPVPANLALVVAQGLAISAATQGAFDMTLGQAVNAWGFGPDRIATLPDAPQPLGQFWGLSAQLDPPALKRTAPFALDLSGIAKGFGVDELARVLEAQGINDYLVEIDGELRARGRKPGLDGIWTVALDAPIRGQRTAWDVLEARDCALATSGDYRHFVENAGKLRAHTIDGRTGWPVANTLASVTVRHTSCMVADAWASALMVLGPSDGPAVAEAQNIAAIFLIRDGDGITEKRIGQFGTV